MADNKRTNGIGKDRAVQTEAAPQKGDKLLYLAHTCIQDTKELTNAFSTVVSSLNSRKVTETDNAVKMSQSATDAQKEANRHREQMAKIEQELQKISNAATDREKVLSFVQELLEELRAEYEKYLSMETKEFLTDDVTSKRERLRKEIMELTKELLKQSMMQ